MASALKQTLVRTRDRLPLPVQRLIHRFSYHLLLSAEERGLWEQRLQDVLSCRDNECLPRHPKAGTIHGGVMTMHNGLQIHAGSYYGWGSHQVLVQNRGCHEPQEERAFDQVLNHLQPGSCMIELGAYWAFYSAWFGSRIPQARNLMVEPEAGNLAKGQRNFALNQLQGTFLQAYIGAAHRPSDTPASVSVDGLRADHQLERIHLLHSDIQGFELDMLRGAERSFAERAVDHVFISTHSNELHRDCLHWLTDHHYLVRHDIDLDASFSHDGLIVAQSPDLPPLPPLELDRRTVLDS